MSTLNPSSSGENIIFKSDQHAANISEKLLSFYEKSEIFDTILIAGSECVNIHANRNVLAAASEYFLEIFRRTHIASKGNQVELKEIDATALKLIVDFMYSGWIVLNLKNAERILRTAATLKMKTLVDGCCEFIEKHIDTSNCLKWFLLSKELSLSALEDDSLKYTYTRMDEISKKTEFLQLNEAELKDLLFNAHSNGDFEEDVFRSMMAWIEYDKVNREHLLCRLLKMIRYQFLTPKFINENRNSVCKNVEISELVFSWLQWHLSSESELVSDHHQSTISVPKKVEGKLAIIYTTKEQDIVIQTYNPELNSWSIEKDTRIWKRKSSYSLIVIGKKLFIGGYTSRNGITVECLDLNTFKWSDLPPMQRKRYNGCNLADLNGNLVVSGSDKIFTDCKNWTREDEFNDSIEIYNFSMREWQLKMMSDKSNNTGLYCYKGLLYIVDFEKKCLESFDISTNQWTSKSIKTECCRFLGFGKFLYFIGGYKNNSNELLMSVKRYDILEDTWCEMAPSPVARFPIRPTVFGNKILIFGEKQVDEYDPETDTWKTLSPLSITNISSNICTFAYE